mmetsp:Transcript_6870/g.16867  ORF Transcript_6870/g.16867 Transcript_6870/m.16867 type:complete len:307 (-) Transcript_6870:316-1236(-)
MARCRAKTWGWRGSSWHGAWASCRSRLAAPSGSASRSRPAPWAAPSAGWANRPRAAGARPARPSWPSTRASAPSIWPWARPATAAARCIFTSARPGSRGPQRVVSQRSASAKSSGHVTLKLAIEARTSRGARPRASTALASSVAAAPIAVSARSTRPRRNICGVCAAHLSRRSSVALTRPSASPAFSVSATGWASRPPTGSCWQASINASTHPGCSRQRAASCTSTQSSSSAPRARNSARPPSTLSARLAPPTRATQAGHDGTAASKRSSVGESTTSVCVRRGTAARAASVWASRGRPAMYTYCLG